MKPTLTQFVCLAFLAGGWPLLAEITPAAVAPENPPVRLSPFVVNASASTASRYTSFESTSTGRVRVNLMDSSQSVSVITSEVIDDVAAIRVVDATRYVAGISDATLPTSWEFSFIRGFLAEGRTVDGITYGASPNSGLQNIDPAIIGRIEIVKGPNSILAPQPTSPGGTVNLATKKPQFRNFGSIGVQWGEFDANSGYVDVNRLVGDKLAFRFVGSGRYNDHWWQDAWVRSTTLMPAFTYRFSDQVEATLQYTYTDWDAQNYFGLPIDPTSGTTTTGRLLAGVPRDLNLYPDDVSRATRQHETKLLITAELWKGIQMRLLTAYNTSSSHLTQINTGPSTGGTGGSVDPLTGQWNYGFAYLQTPPYAPFPIPSLPTRTFVRSGVETLADPRQFNFQNDYAYIFDNNSLKSTTLAGFAYAEQRNANAKSYLLTLTAPTFNIDQPVDTGWSRGRNTVDGDVTNRFMQFYMSETLVLLQNRLILNAAESWQDYDSRVADKLKQVSANASSHTALPSYGIVIKPYRDAISLYYSYTEQSSSNGVSTTATIPPLSTSRQDEIGARFKLWDSRFYFTVSHYEIEHENFAAPNPGNLRTPPPVPPLPNIFADRTAKGWEYELRASPVHGLSLMASYTHFENRDTNGVEFRGVAEQAGSVLASYTFDRENIPALDGFRLAVGVDYVSDRAGDSVTEAFTPASTPANPIPIQPSFFLGSRTLVNLTLAYDSRRHWSAQVNIDNLFDEEYLQSGIHRQAVFPGPPTNVKVSVRYGF